MSNKVSRVIIIRDGRVKNTNLTSKCLFLARNCLMKLINTQKNMWALADWHQLTFLSHQLCANETSDKLSTVNLFNSYLKGISNIQSTHIKNCWPIFIASNHHSILNPKNQMNKHGACAHHETRLNIGFIIYSKHFSIKAKLGFYCVDNLTKLRSNVYCIITS